MIRAVLYLLLTLQFHAAVAESVDKSAIVQMSVQELRTSLDARELTAVEVVQAFIARIDALDDAGPRLNAIIEINPDAVSIAQALDRKMQSAGPVGPLHGIPVVLKANIDTGDKMVTSAGSIALAEHRASKDAFHVARLREAGAVILGKANLSEWANFRSLDSVSGWSSLGGQTKNPYATDRNPCGSSSGSAVAVSARLSPLAVGTETDGSIVCPAGINGIVGIKPTVGLVSRSGIIPIAHTQDTAGPMANTVYGAALLLESMAGEDAADPASVAAAGRYLPDTAQTRLDGVRVGVWRGYFGADNSAVRELLDQGVTVLNRLGAEIVDPLELEVPASLGAAEFQVLLHEFKDGLNRYLASHSVDDTVNSLAKLIAFNESNADAVMPIFDQSLFLLAEATSDLTSAEYVQAVQDSHTTMRSLLDAAMQDNSLDVIVAPVNAPSWKTDWVNGDTFSLSSARLAAVSGFPSVAVPAGQVAGLPIGLAFIGSAFEEADLIQYAYVFEQALQARREPKLLPRVGLEEDL